MLSMLTCASPDAARRLRQRASRTGQVDEAQEAQQRVGRLAAGQQRELRVSRQVGRLQHVGLVVVEAVAGRQRQLQQEAALPAAA